MPKKHRTAVLRNQFRDASGCGWHADYRWCEFKNLTLAIVDEQHRFGVRQRQALGDQQSADMLVMSATPIPRSLADSGGDFTVSSIRDMPAYRKRLIPG